MKRSRGNLSPVERAQMIGTIVGLRLSRRFLRAPQATGCVNVSDIPSLPDSSLVKQAIECCAEECSKTIFNHSCRTFVWGALLARLGGIRFDVEELALAALLHDVELGKVERRDAWGCVCFAGASARSAQIWLERRAVAKPSVQAIAEAIALHLNPEVSLARGALAHLLNAGAAADVVGSQLSLISGIEQTRVLAGYPRLGFKLTMIGAMNLERKHAPKSRSGFLMGAGFAKLIQAAPFSD
jgi:hypothetical protein